MKLYEFTYTDKQNLREEDLLARVEDFLTQESELQGWAQDYKFRQCQKPEQAAAGEKNYFFEVMGTYVDTDSVTRAEDSEAPSGSQRSPHAARDINP